GATATTDGVATVSDGGIWNIGSILLVGYDTGSTALLSIGAGGTVNVNNPSTLDSVSVVIADQAGTNGTISVGGAGATLDAGVNTFVIGQYGDGTLTISNGGAVTANTDTPSSDAAAIVGHEAGSTGVVTVSGTGSIFKVLQQFDVGSYGTGDVTVSNGGSLVTGNGTGGLILGFEQGTGTGFLTVNGGNVTNSGRFQVGGYGSGAMLIENGGTVTTSRASPSFSSPGAAIGDRTTGGAASVTVTGTGSTWNLANGPLVVSYGPASSLAIQAGGTVTANEVDVAAVANAIGTVTADGSGSRLSMRNDLSIAGNPAAAGGTGDVAVTNSAFVGAPLLYMWSGATLSDDATGTVEIGSLGGAAAGDITVDPGVVATGAGTIEGTVIDNGTLTDVRTSLTLTGTELGSGTLRMGGTADLVLDAAQGITGSISGFSTGQTLDLANVHFASVSLGYSGNTLTVTDGTTTANLDIGPGYTLGDFSTLADSNGGTEIFTSQVMPCYLAGSRILTTRGEIAVEALAVGNIAITASGRHAPIAWIGRREVDCRHHPQPERVMPVRIRAGAFGKATPSRDLLLSPDHAVLAESVLIPVRCLVEGVSIVQERVHRAAYFHVELDRHDLLVAEGLAAESYLDSGNRRQFANGGGSMSLHADFAASAREGACAPLVLCGTAVQRTRQRLRARATRRGGTTGPWVVVDGRAMRPAAVVNGRLRFILPAGSQEIRLPEEIGVMGLLADGRTLAEAAPGCWRLPAVRQPTPVVLELRLGSAADRVARAA
ncbi:MAG: Hint domain-containing protein, partial [Acidisphaera sp.]|nr:Hint domain-containing protein [Acidisphaera sp.]